MSDVTIQVEGLSKRYAIGALQKYKALRDTLTDVLYAPFRGASSIFKGRRSAGAGGPANSFIWALKDISFEIKRGEVVAIIGRNGAGKSTLLKILSRITEPTSGYAEIHGRVGSLLEVGTGFHPELTGRENIYLNGAILGMRKAEIDSKFDEIVAFAEIEKFIDTPVKYYSSGMYLRLAFGVAAHLEPEILLVDEVLAVGDAVFQKKCLGKMESIGAQGRTVLFVSHNMGTITSLCHRAVMLKDGQIVQDGPATQVVSSYLGTGLEAQTRCIWLDPAQAPGNDVARLRAVRLITADGIVSSQIDRSCRIGIQVEYWRLAPRIPLFAGIWLYNDQGLCLFYSADLEAPASRTLPKSVGLYRSTCWIPPNLLKEGLVTVSVAVATRNPPSSQARQDQIVSFTVLDQRDDRLLNVPGVIQPSLKWTVEADLRTSDLPTCKMKPE